MGTWFLGPMTSHFPALWAVQTAEHQAIGALTRNLAFDLGSCSTFLKKCTVYKEPSLDQSTTYLRNATKERLMSSDAVASFLQEFCLRKKFLQDTRNLARILHLVKVKKV